MMVIILMLFVRTVMNVIGFDEELADAISKSFYESYKTWKIDHPNDGKRKQVINAIHTIN